MVGGAYAVLILALVPAPHPRDGLAIRNVQLQEYVPGGGGRTPPANAPNPSSTAPPRRSDGTAPRSAGSGTPPDQLTTPVSPPRIAPLPAAPGSEDATARFKRDLLTPGVNALEREKARGNLTIDQQRDLMRRRQELHRLEGDPLKR